MTAVWSQIGHIKLILYFGLYRYVWLWFLILIKYICWVQFGCNKFLVCRTVLFSLNICLHSNTWRITACFSFQICQVDMKLISYEWRNDWLARTFSKLVEAVARKKNSARFAGPFICQGILKIRFLGARS